MIMEKKYQSNKKILREWSETDGFEYAITNEGEVYRRLIGNVSDYIKVVWSYTLKKYL